MLDLGMMTMTTAMRKVMIAITMRMRMIVTSKVPLLRRLHHNAPPSRHLLELPQPLTAFKRY